MYRVPRVRPQRITLPKFRERRPVGVSLLTLVYGFAILIGLGSLLLMLPAAASSGQSTPFITALFTSASAVCITGLVVVDTMDHWSLFGQAVLLVLIQLGGLGIMTSATIFLLAAGRRIGLRGRILIGESFGLAHIGGIVRLVRNIVYFSLISEAVGAILFFIRFGQEYGWQSGAWRAVFQSVSAFNNAGFYLSGGYRSLLDYQNDYLVVLTTAFLVILGGISFAVIQDIFRSRGVRQVSLDTHLVIRVTLMLLVLGTVIVLAVEFNNPQTLGPLTLPEKVLNAFFQSVTTRSAGFETLSMRSLIDYTLFLSMLLMFIGGATGSTTGGIKVNTFGLIMATIWNTIRGREYPRAFGREFEVHQIFRALTLLVLALGIILLVFILLSIAEEFPSQDILFETVSAFGTVGLSTGITPGLSIFGQIVLVFTMFIGRLGPLTLTMALSRTQRVTEYRYPKELIRIG